ncbi:AAA-domain-containing protein [Schizopora paradoxa]|uniref:Peroxisomal ATPase PEX6 n=1 Tax=Schizopora paradoxa TaxID=27342 RepID=A0A0H2R6P2_9AGAM|nr:AAA-domain-containing protein [Schizopora paradoxa]
MTTTSRTSLELRVQVHVADPIGPSSSTHVYDDRAFASPDVWQRLGALSLDFGKYDPWNLTRGGMLQRPTLFWLSPANQDSPTAKSGVYLSATYASEFTKLSDISCSATAVKPILLSEIILVALSESAFDLAHRLPAEIEEWFCRGSRLIRQGSKYTCHVVNGFVEDAYDQSTDARYTFEVAISEPVLQGIARVGSTRLLVTLGPPNPSVRSPSVDPSSPIEDDVSIDEFFLAGSTLTEGKASRNGHGINGILSVNGHGVVSPPPSPPESPKPFTDGITVSFNSLEHVVNNGHDSSTTVYLRTSALAQMGVFDGDWAIAEGAYRRLIQVRTADDLLDSQELSLTSPTLRRNMAPNKQSSDEVRLQLRASPFGAGPPVIPTAKTATLARIASPESIDRSHQKSFLQSLKRYFAGTKRIVKKGDLIAVGISTAPTFDSIEDEDTKEDTSAVVEDAEDDDVQPDSLVFFVVTNLEYDVLPQSEDRTFSDSFLQAAMGELGCWVDPTVTRMVQTGLEHSIVPDMTSFLGLDTQDFCPSRFPMKNSTAYKKLHDFANAPLRENAADYGLELSVLLNGAQGSGSAELAQHVARTIGYHILKVNVYDTIAETENKTFANLKEHFNTATSCAPCVLILENVDAFAQTTQRSETNKEPAIVSEFRECISELSQAWKRTTFPVVVVGTSSQVESIPSGILTCFKQEISCDVPNEREREDILKAASEGDVLGADVSLKNLATQTAALTFSDILDLISRSRLCCIERTMKAIRETDNDESDAIHAGLVLTKADFDVALEKARASFSQSIGAPSIPNVSWDDVGGLASVKEDILDTIQLPLDHPELFADGLKQRSGILLYGPPGTGKTLLAKAVATSCSLNFFSVKGPELLNMYIGESEANVRRVFQRARDASPCVIFFDELDSVAPKRGNQGDSGGVMDRIVSQLLAELDGMSSTGSASSVFVIGATNRPDLLDPALLRPGRFDRMLYLGISETHDAQLKILEALTRKFRLDPDLDLRTIAERCPFNYTGADFYALCSDSMLKAMSRKAEEVDAKIARLNASSPILNHQYPITPQYYLSAMAEPSDTDVLVSSVDFEQALAELVPSVSQSELEHYKAVQQRFTNDAPAKRKGKGKEVQRS